MQGIGCGLWRFTLSQVLRSKGITGLQVDVDRETMDLLTIQDSGLFDPLVAHSCQSLTDSDFEDESFDLETCISVLEHLEAREDTKALDEILGVLKTGRRLIVTVDLAPTP